MICATSAYMRASTVYLNSISRYWFVMLWTITCGLNLQPFLVTEEETAGNLHPTSMLINIMNQGHSRPFSLLLSSQMTTSSSRGRTYSRCQGMLGHLACLQTSQKQWKKEMRNQSRMMSSERCSSKNEVWPLYNRFLATSKLSLRMFLAYTGKNLVLVLGWSNSTNYPLEETNLLRLLN